ncbi:hypothetical protein BH20CHL6_BH20CHL6_13070 [soil metagenome]
MTAPRPSPEEGPAGARRGRRSRLPPGRRSLRQGIPPQGMTTPRPAVEGSGPGRVVVSVSGCGGSALDAEGEEGSGQESTDEMLSGDEGRLR